MPLERGTGPATIAHNIAEMVRAGHPQKQAVAAAMREARGDMDCDRLDTMLSACDALTRRFDALVEGRKTPDEPYGSGNDYADPGYEPDGKKRYPLGSAEEIRAAWDYIHKGRDADKYSPAHLKEIRARIMAAWKRKIDKDGPPEAR